MPDVFSANLIRLFDFYLALAFLVGLWRRRGVYLDAVRIALSTYGKRRRLLERVGGHKHLLLSTDVVRPFLVVVGLTVVQWVCSRLIWPHANISVRDLATVWWQLPIVVAAFLPMFAVDLYFLINVARFDRGSTEVYLDYAETWLGWRAPVVRVITLGIVNPRRIVDAEMRKSLQQLTASASWAMWWTSVQSGLRVTFGLVIWLLWVFG
jgi:hypothetical protein